MRNNNKLLAIVLVVGAGMIFTAKISTVSRQLTTPPPAYSEDGVEVQSCAEKECCKAIKTGCDVAFDKEERREKASEHSREQPNIKQNSAFIAERVRRTELAAQRGMWRATNALVSLTLWQTALGVFGLGFILWTLMETRDASKAAARSARAAENAESANLYPEITVVAGRYKLFDEEDDPADQFPRMHVSIDVNVKNFGRTPAKNVFLELRSNQVIFDQSEARSGSVTHTVKENLFIPQGGEVLIESVFICDKYPIGETDRFKESPICVMNLKACFFDCFGIRKEIEIETKVFLNVTLSRQVFPDADPEKARVISKGYVDFEGRRIDPVRHETRITKETQSD